MHIGISRHGIPFLSFSLVFLLAMIGISVNWEDWARYPLISLGALLFALFLAFFRDPERISFADGRAILAPADGKVIRVAKAVDESYPDSNGILISIFMSLLNVHVNRAPVSGKIIKKVYRQGRFLPAFKDGASEHNEQCSLIIQNDGRPILLRQVSGILARRIITYPQEGETIVRGDRLGMILFGSRLDVIVPSSTEITVSDGQKTVAGKTILGILS